MLTAVIKAGSNEGRACVHVAAAVSEFIRKIGDI